MKTPAKLLLVAAAGLALSNVWPDQPQKSAMDILADEIALCEGVADTERLGHRTKTRIDITLNPDTTLADVEGCVRKKVEGVDSIQTSIVPTCFSDPVLEASDEDPQKASVVFGRTTCFPRR